MPGFGVNSSTTSIGTLGVGNNFSSAAIDLNITGGTYQVDLLGTTNDLLTDTGTTTIAAAGTTLDIRTGTFNPTDGQQWTILTAASVAGTTSAPFATITDDNAGFDFSAAIVGGNSVVLTASAVVPEPASVGLLGLGALAMLGRRGRRKDR